jgi:DMSO/TMAO reductase YedYZ molybdopterin-dependent catalytic subunit
VLVLTSLVTGRRGFIEVVADGVTAYVPLSVFSAGLSTFGPLAKGLLHLGVAGGIVVAAALVAYPALRWTRGQAVTGSATWIGIAGLLIVELVILPVFGAGFFGLDLGTDLVALQVPVVVAAFTYGAVLARLRDRWALESSPFEATALQTTQPASADALAWTDGTGATGNPGMSRRSLLARSIVVIGAGSLAGAFSSLAAQAIGAVKPATFPTAEGPTAADPFGPTPALTPVGDFYQVSKNLLPTQVDAAAWRFTVDGLVERPFQLTLQEVRALTPVVTGYRTLECISTEIVRGDHLIGNQKWRGVPLTALLDRAGVKPEASWVLWEAEDGFTESLPLEVARESDSWLVYEMGDAPLTAEHGFPARILIAGRFGMKQPKWVSRMQLADHDEAGYWQERGWDKDAFVLPMSRIDFPASRSQVTAGEPFWMTGIASTGDRGVMRVEVSLDGGTEWVEAESEDASLAPLGPLTWVRWRYRATLAKPGAYRMAVRTTDGAGVVQDGQTRDALPSGSTGWHRVFVTAVAPTA